MLHRAINIRMPDVTLLQVEPQTAFLYWEDGS